MVNRHLQTKFSKALLHPRYWGNWCTLGLLYLIVLFPYPIIRKIGVLFGKLIMKIMKKRVNIARRNLILCFPTMPEDEREALIIKNFESTGMGILETAMAWFWSDRRIKKIFTVIGIENITQARKNGRGVLIIGLHFLTLELGARIFGIYNPGVGVYRPNDNPLIDWIQTWGRLRSNKYVIDRKNVKGMIRALKAGEILWYAPDHDYGPRNSVFVPFFAVPETATTIGPTILVRMANPAIIPFTPMRNADGKGYTLYVQPMLENFPIDDEIKAATFMNQAIEKEILLALDQYMWLHRRFKTRPKGSPSLY